jgi:catechol 2,3-dioxygenase-like lactoylglutathione lyase family enzyme
MVGYTTLGTNDLPRAIAFYDALLGDIGAKQLMGDDRMVVWGKGGGGGMLAVCRPFDEGRATVGNGVMVALQMESPDAVKAFHARAIELGATDEGEPGPRGEGGFHGGYFRDLDGNKLCGFCFA